MLQVLFNTNDATQFQIVAGKGGGTPEVRSPNINTSVIIRQIINVFLWVKNTGSVPLTVSASGLIGTTSVASNPTVLQPNSNWTRVNVSFVAIATGTLTFNILIDAALAGFKCLVFQPIVLLGNNLFTLPTGFTNFTSWLEGNGNNLTITQNQSRTFDYTRYVESGSLTITEELNQTAQCKFSLENIDDAFIVPSIETYVQIFSNQYNRYVFTGFISVDFQRDYVGMNSKTPSTNFQTYRYSITCAGDEYLLAAKAVPFLPPFVNMGAGQILAMLANTLAPGFFDVTSKCASGDLIPYQEYDPNKNWSVMAKELADQFRYRVRILNKVLYYQPYGDQSFPITYDDTSSQRNFDPKGLQTSIYNTTLANDAIIIGDIEASDNHEDYFVGDGFSSNFPLRYTVFDGDTAHLLNQDWTDSSIDSSKWFEQDPTNAIALAGALNVNGGTNHFGETYLYLRTGLDFGRKIVLNHGEIFLVGNCSGAIIGGVYDNASTFAEVNGSGQCECGFDIRPAPGFTVAVSVSGTSGLQIQPRRLGQLLGTPVITQQNHYYVLRTIINGKSVNRYTTTFKSLTGAIVQGGTNSAIADITWVITDIDLNNTNPNMPGFVNTQPPWLDTRFTLNNAAMPAFGLYVPLNISNANLTLQWTDIFDPPQGSLSVASLSGVSGGQLPILPGNIGPRYDYELGFGIGRQIATLGNASNVSTGGASSDGTGSELQFYSDSIPGVGSRIKIQAWEAQASVARVQDPVSIAKEAAVVGDDGHRVAIMTDFKPLPRSSEECELAGKAALADRTTTIYQGSYTVEDTFFDFVHNDYPRAGEFFVINSPQRGLVNFSAVCSSVTIKYIETFSERSTIVVNFGPTTFLQNLLAMFVPKPNNTLLPQNTAKPPSPIQLANVGTAFCADLDKLTLSGGPVPGLGHDSLNIYVDAGFTPIAGQFIEVRQTNFGWGLANNDRLGIFQTRNFTLPRTRFDATWYFRLLQGTLNGAGSLNAGGLTSRRSKILRVYAPIVPAPPQVINADSSEITAFFNGDIRNIYGIELREPDNATVLVQKPVSTPTDMNLDLVALKANRFWISPNLLLSTEEVDSVVWDTQTNTSISANVALDPNGFGPNADLVSFPLHAANAPVPAVTQRIASIKSIPGQDPIPLDGRTFTFSIWLRTSGGTASVEMLIADNSLTNFIPTKIVTVTNQWQRFSVTGSVPKGVSPGLLVQFRQPIAQTQGGIGVFVWGAQLEEASLPGTYFANVDSYGPRNLLQATEELDNQDFWVSTSPSVTGGVTQITVPFNKLGITVPSSTYPTNAGFDDFGSTLQSTELGSSVNFAGCNFVFGTASNGASGINVMACNGQVIPIPINYYNSIRFIAAGIGFSPNFSGSFIVNYSDGTSTVFPQVFTNWANVPTTAPGELIAVTMAHVGFGDGSTLTATVKVYHYQFNLDNTKRVVSISCPANRGIVILAMDALPQSYQTIVTPNAILDPLGNLTADQINYAPKGAATESVIKQVLNPSLVKNKTFTLSMWLKTSGANVNAEVIVQDIPFTINAIGQTVAVTNQWQRFVFTGSFASGSNSRIRVSVGSIFGSAVGAQLLYVWGVQLEYADSVTTYLGNGNVLRPFYLYFFNVMWAYSPQSIAFIASPAAPNLTLGSKLANSIDFRLDRLDRGDIKQTTLQLSTDGSFLTSSNISVTGQGQPASFNMNVAGVALSAFFARARRKDIFNEGAWSPVIFIPYGTIIASSWVGGQGSIPPSLDNQVSALFTATTSALAGGGANTGRIVLSWPTFIITFPDQTQQLVAGGSFDTGTTLTSTVGTATPYIFYPRLRAQVPGSQPEFVNGPHNAQTVADAQICQADGYFPLGGATLSLTFNVPSANPGGGGTSSGGGTGGGSKCIPESEIVSTTAGDIEAKDSTLKNMLLGADPDTKETHWNSTDSIVYGEAICVEIELEDGSKGKCSIDTDIPVWLNDNTYSYVKPLNLNKNYFLLSKKGEIHLERIKRITNIGMQKVVTFTVRPWHTLFAGDILTHNAVLPKG